MAMLNNQMVTPKTMGLKTMTLMKKTEKHLSEILKVVDCSHMFQMLESNRCKEIPLSTCNE